MNELWEKESKYGNKLYNSSDIYPQVVYENDNEGGYDKQILKSIIIERGNTHEYITEYYDLTPENYKPIGTSNRIEIPSLGLSILEETRTQTFSNPNDSSREQREVTFVDMRIQGAGAKEVFGNGIYTITIHTQDKDQILYGAICLGWVNQHIGEKFLVGKSKKEIRKLPYEEIEKIERQVKVIYSEFKQAVYNNLAGKEPINLQKLLDKHFGENTVNLNEIVEKHINEIFQQKDKRTEKQQRKVKSTSIFGLAKAKIKTLSKERSKKREDRDKETDKKYAKKRIIEDLKFNK